MKNTIILTPLDTNIGLTSVSLGFVRSLERHGLKVNFLEPISTESNNGHDIDKTLEDFDSPLSLKIIEQLLSNGEEEKILEFILGYINAHTTDSDEFIVVKLIALKKNNSYISRLNNDIASSLSAKVILVTSPKNQSLKMLAEQIELEAIVYGGIANEKILGVIINHVGAPTDESGNIRIDSLNSPKKMTPDERKIDTERYKILGLIPWKKSLMTYNIKTIAEHLNAKLLTENDCHNHCVENFVIASARIEHIYSLLKPNVMIITSGDRIDILIAVSMAYLSGMHLGGIILTNGLIPEENILKLCNKAIQNGLPILSTKNDSLKTTIALHSLQTKKHLKSPSNIEATSSHVADYIDISFIESLKTSAVCKMMSPPAFRFKLIEKAKEKEKKIVLPEGDDIRILQAADFCAKKNIAKITLLGDNHAIDKLCQDHGFSLDKKIEIINPTDIAHQYVDDLVQLRKHKGLTKANAQEYLHDPIVVGMMMLEKNVVDGLVAGANTTTANVVSPALKILKTAPGASLVSSIFFMCLPQEVVVYGDCAVNQNPTSEQLADIAVQSADSAKQFDIDPKIAMISYSTGSSGGGEDVQKVRKATEIVQKKHPSILCDGPLQYDAAKSPDVAKKKAPDSKVAGKASVFIFPDLNTANTTYKAVQRTAGVLSIGPVLQGLKKPVNDLSRGATVDDIIYTIAITAIQG